MTVMEVLIGHTQTALCIEVTIRDRTEERHIEIFNFCANSVGFFFNSMEYIAASETRHKGDYEI